MDLNKETMMNVQRLIVAVAAATLGVGTVSVLAQPAEREGREPRRPMMERPGGWFQGRMMEDLNLTAEQQKQVDQILAEQRKQIAAIMQDSREKISKVLTEEQRAKFQERAPEARGAGFGGPGAGPAGPLHRAVNELNLTDDQKAKVDAIFAKQREKMQALRQDGDGDREARQQQVRALIENTQKEVTAVLTPEQNEKLKKQLDQWRDRRDERPRRGPEGERGPGRQDRPDKPRKK